MPIHSIKRNVTIKLYEAGIQLTIADMQYESLQ